MNQAAQGGQRSLSGLLQVSARFHAATGHVDAFEVTLQRPPVTRLFIGKTPAQVAPLVPCLYALCAEAQHTAAQAALAAASADSQTDSPPPAHPDRALWVEFLHENLWRLLLDWPPALVLPNPEGLALQQQAKQAFTQWRSERLGAKLTPATASLLQTVLAPLSAVCLAALEVSAESGGADLDDALPLSLAASDLAALAHDSAPAPTSVASAYRQRLAAVEAAFVALRDGLPYPVYAVGGKQQGLARTLTARGILTHQVTLENGVVSAYRVIAPTDCHFASAQALQGLLDTALGMAQVASPTDARPNNNRWPVRDINEARRRIEQAILALDPCVPYQLELHDA
jgi:hypothetical protein